MNYKDGDSIKMETQVSGCFPQSLKGQTGKSD